MTVSDQESAFSRPNRLGWFLVPEILPEYHTHSAPLLLPFDSKLLDLQLQSFVLKKMSSGAVASKTAL
eukprot:IDg17020t1